MAYLQNRGNKWRAKVRIPASLRAHYGDREFLQRTMEALDKPTAKAEAEAWEAGLRSEWASQLSMGNTSRVKLRQVYEDGRQAALGGQYDVHSDDADPMEQGIEFEIDKLAEQDRSDSLSDAGEARLAALQDALQEHRGHTPVRRAELEQSFSEAAAEYLDLWATQRGLKESNTRQQKEATFRLFGGFFKDKPLRDVKRADAAAFMDILRRLDPKWSRSPKTKDMTWQEILQLHGKSEKGLSASTLNRHATTLQELWKWGEARERCEGRNPFAGLRERMKQGKNQFGYLPWEPDELRLLFNPPPKREDVKEVMVVALYTGMRLNEIASLRLGNIRRSEGVAFIDVEDAKTPAGNRQVPIHPAIAWLGELQGAPEDRIWPEFNPEGPGKKPGADAGKEFSRFKLAKGFSDRRKVFHSFRKNVTQIMERKGVPENEWAQVLGHERGLTYGRYSPHGIALSKKAELIGLIEYPDIELPTRAGTAT